MVVLSLFIFTGFIGWIKPQCFGSKRSAKKVQISTTNLCTQWATLHVLWMCTSSLAPPPTPSWTVVRWSLGPRLKGCPCTYITTLSMSCDVKMSKKKKLPMFFGLQRFDKILPVSWNLHPTVSLSVLYSCPLVPHPHDCPPFSPQPLIQCSYCTK